MKELYKKDFEGWNMRKQAINARALPEDFYVLEGEIWWVSLGVNVGQEIDGKNEAFERPVLILKKFSPELVWALPITSLSKVGEYFCPIQYASKQGSVVLLQLRNISVNRFLRLVDRISEEEFSVIKAKLIDFISSITKIPSN